MIVKLLLTKILIINLKRGKRNSCWQEIKGKEALHLCQLLLTDIQSSGTLQNGLQTSPQTPKFKVQSSKTIRQFLFFFKYIKRPQGPKVWTKMP
jgi:hypothetical protein